jgi:hypothetical protein
MRKWRPTHKCIYIISDINGNMDSLEVILNRILPLRLFANQEDVVVMLGDYVDIGKDSAKVIDCIINIKKEYKDRIILIKGNHDVMMQRACLGSDDDFSYWVNNGGIATIESYINYNKLSSNPYSIKRNRILDLVPKEHIEFLQLLEPYSIINEYCFFHGGFNQEKSIKDNNISNFPFDYTSSKYIKTCFKNKIQPSFIDDYIYVGSHNYMSDVPAIYNRYFMLGETAPNKLISLELNSMSAVAVSKNKSRIYKYNLSICE